MLKNLIITAAVVSALFMLAGCNGEAQPQQQMPPPTVIVIAAHTDNVTEAENFVGKVDAAARASIGARVSGFLEKRLVREGDMVKKDQILFAIEKSQYIAAVRQAEASLAQARANLNNAGLQRERGEALLKSSSISQANYDNLNAAYLVAQANTEAAQAALDNARLNLSYTDVTSPIDGKVGLINCQIGETVGPSVGVITTVVAQEPMYVLFSITDRQLQSLRKMYTNDSAGMDFKSVLGSLAEMRITLSDGSVYPYPGKINFTDNVVMGTTDSLRVRGEFPNPNGFLTPGQTVSVSLQSKTLTSRIVIPQAAIQNDISGKYVLVVGDNGSVARRIVSVGAQLGGGRQVVLDNLTEGELIIVDGVQKVRPNTPVNAMTQEQYNEMLQQQAQSAADGGGM